MKDGIYEQIINSEIFLELRALEDEKLIERSDLDQMEAPALLSHYLSRIIERSLEIIRDDRSSEAGSLERQIGLANRIIDVINVTLGHDFTQPEILRQGRLLQSITSKLDRSVARPIRPELPLTLSSLFTGDPSEPTMMSEFHKEILSSDAIYMIVSFIMKRGVVLIYDQLKYFSEVLKRPIYILTTTYMGNSHFSAIEMLAKLPTAQVKISYDSNLTRLHAKSYIFERHSGFSTAYVGSSNLSKAAFTDGAEWNIKLTEQHSPAVFKKMRYTFERYWNDSGFVSYDPANEAHRTRLGIALSREGRRSSDPLDMTLSGFDIRPYDFQKVILDMLQAEREVHGHYKNLLVAATGVGKTVISAFDYQRFLKEKPGARLLFVAHRQEILRQSLIRFREILKDPNFGELQTGHDQAQAIDHLFITIQSFASQNLIARTSPGFYDYIIVDEFHRAAADSYQDLLAYYQPKILLGLTATPERMDGKDIFKYFDHRIASEMRLPEAIEKRLLVPFHYFCIDDDSVDLRQVEWVGGGYSEAGLYDLYRRVNQRRIRTIARSLDHYLDSISDMKALGFCVTVEHAELMADSFNKLGIPAISVTGQTDRTTRSQAVSRLESGEIKVIFTVDVYNEGVDIPLVNTVLFLRPTQSLTVFLQQLGRGLRTAPGKEQLTVLDFVAQAHEKYHYEDKFRALLYRSPRSLYESLKDNNLALPAGCHFRMEKMAQTIILDNIRQAIIDKRLLVRRLEAFSAATEQATTLANFLDYYAMPITDFYGRDRSFSELYLREKLDPTINRRLKNLITLDGYQLLSAGIDFFRDGKAFEDDRQLAIYYYSFYDQPPKRAGFLSMHDGLETIRRRRAENREIVTILEYKHGHVGFVSQPVILNSGAPLEVGASYTLSQVLAAVGYFNGDRAPAFREGVLHLKDAQTDLFFVTIQKSQKDYSEATRYEDYYISEEKFHWQSQNKVRDDSDTAMRYRTHRENDHDILLFVREHKALPSGITSPYRFVGNVKYLEDHGSQPVSFVWQIG
ncbi:MAG TPA: DUF3427 domain-containing protein [Tissierellia bacterium]|nr:DUF3427 domain-containing protein [Tissierellia bacterium]